MDIWLILQMREQFGLWWLLLGLLLLGALVARARPPGFFTRLLFRARAERHGRRTPFWRAALAVLALVAFLYPHPGGRYAAGFLALRSLTTEHAHWYDRRRAREAAPLPASRGPFFPRAR